MQETFLRFMIEAPLFEEKVHEKACLIRTATNICKDMKRYRIRHNHLNIDALNEYFTPEIDNDLIKRVLLLPDKYKTVIHLYYIEGYKTEEMAAILKIKPEAVRKRLQYARQKLKFVIEEEELNNHIIRGLNHSVLCNNTDAILASLDEGFADASKIGMRVEYSEMRTVNSIDFLVIYLKKDYSYEDYQRDLDAFLGPGYSSIEQFHFLRLYLEICNEETYKKFSQWDKRVLFLMVDLIIALV